MSIDTDSAAVLAKVKAMREELSALLDEHSYCTSHTEALENAFIKTIRAIETEEPTDDL